jgi:hypothetical protein
VEVNCNFLVVKYVVKDEEVVDAHVRSRVHQTVNLQELLEVFVSLLILVFIFQFHHVEVLLSIPQLVG